VISDVTCFDPNMFRAQYLANGWRYRFSYDGAPTANGIWVSSGHHRLNGSSSPVLTATCLSYGRLCDFLGFFSEPTWRSHPSTDFDAKWLKRCGFTQGRNFLKPLTPRPPKPPKFAQFWSGLREFSLDFAFNIGGLTSKHPLFFIGAE